MASHPAPEIRQASEWFTAGELAEMKLPGLPHAKRSIARLAQEERWTTRHDANGELLVRPRAGRGGGVEFHVSLLPGAARLEMARRGITAPCPSAAALLETEENHAALGGWRWYEAQSARVKAEAGRRNDAVRSVLMLEEAGLTRSAAVHEIAGRQCIGNSTLWSWLRMVDGVPPADRLPALAPRRRGGGSEVDIHPLLWSMFKSDFLRPSAPTLASCYERILSKAAEMGVSLPSERTMRRRLEREVDPAIIRYRREGEEALRRSIPAQRRTVEHLQALEIVNVDGHKFDIWVEPPGGGKPVRPVMVCIQDVMSSKLLAWKIDLSENAVQTRLAFASLFREYGIPKAALFDNGRAFASKWVTGGAKSRFRFRIRDEEPTGFITALGIEIKWALPYRGQSKPIERAFRDLCDTIARHPAMEGAYTGNSPVNKPENYGSRAIAGDVFEAHVARGIAAHNARLGRRGRSFYRGRSFDQVFAESYATSPVGKATPEQLRMALLTAEQVRVNRQTGELHLYGNRYWSSECAALHGQRVTVRFDPDNLHSEVHLYDQDGRFLTTAELIADTGFDDVAGAKASKKRHADIRRRVREGVEAEQLLEAEELAALLPDYQPAAIPEANVVRAVRFRGSAAVARKPVVADMTRAGAAPIDRVAAAVMRLVSDDD